MKTCLSVVRNFSLIAALLIPCASGQTPLAPEARSRQVLDMLLAGQYDAVYAMLPAQMKSAVTADAFRTQSERIHGLGPVKSFGEPKVQHVKEYTVVVTRLQWATVALEFAVSWDAAGNLSGMWFRPAHEEAPWQRPAYSTPGSFTEHEITIGNDAWKLPGTLTLPNGKGPFPAVVLVHGSGPNDRDESVGGVKVFRDLAEGLASRGIAVLRYDKRTRVYPAQCAADPKITVEQETIQDAVRALALLRQQPGVNPERVFVLGHSLGGYIAPRIAQQDPKLAGIIVFAGSVRPLEDLILDQSYYLAGLRGAISPAAQTRLDEIKQEVDRVKALPAGATNSEKLFGMPVPYLLDLKNYNPADEAKNIPIPFLILQGERDYQVTMKEFALWKAALGARKDVTFRSYPALNHLFVAGEGKSTPAEYRKPGHVDEQVITDLAQWILAPR